MKDERKLLLARAGRHTAGVALMLLLAVAILAAGAGGDFAELDVEAPELASRSNAIPVVSGPVRQVSSFSLERHFAGTVKAPRASELAFDRTDRVIGVLVDEGAIVNEGDPLAQLDTSKLKAYRQQLVAERSQAQAILTELKAGPREETIDVARAEVDRLRAELALRQTQLERRERLVKTGATAQDVVDRSDYDRQATKARLEAANRRLDELHAGTRVEKIDAQVASIARLDAMICQVDIDVRNSTILAPFNGEISKRFVDEGTLVTPGTPILCLLETDNLEAHIGLPLEYSDMVSELSSVETQVDGESYGAWFQALVPELDRQTRTQAVIFSFDDIADSEIIPGQIARLTLEREHPANGFWLPSRALTRGDRGLWNVMAMIPSAVEGCHRTETRIVELLHTDAETVFVRGTLKDGDLVVLDGTHRIVPGQIVRAVRRTAEPTDERSLVSRSHTDAMLTPDLTTSRLEAVNSLEL